MKKTVFVISLIAFIAAGAHFSYSGYKKAHEVESGLKEEKRPSVNSRQADLGKRKAAWKRLIKEIAREVRSFNGTPGIVIKDLDMNWEMQLNKDISIASASVVKIPIMLSYFCAAGEGKVDLESKIRLKKSDRTPGSGKLQHLPDGQEFKIEDLIELMITESDNTAANMLINNMGIDTLNAYFEKLGLKRTNLSRKMMDFRERREGVENYTTASDIAYLLEQMYRGKCMGYTTSGRCINILAGQKVNDRIPKKLPEGTVVAHKTGLENGLCHDAGIVYTGKGNYLICVLVKHNYKSARETKSLISSISLAVYNYFEGL